MKMPNNDQSVIADNKITGYLLSDTHEIGKHKAEYFKRFGFDGTDIEVLKNALLQHAEERDIVNSVATDFGEKYELRCYISTPDKRNPCIVSIWIIENGQTRPQLVTAYPSK